MANKIWEEDKTYNILRYYVDFTTRSLFSSVKIKGRENLPEDGMVMYAPVSYTHLTLPTICSV